MKLASRAVRRRADHSFAERLRRREPAAVELFLAQHSARVERLVRLEVRDEDQARDLTQEVLVNVLRSLPRFRAERPLDPWIFTIARNRMRDYWRSHKRRELSGRHAGGAADEGMAVLDELPARDGCPIDFASGAECADAVRAAVEELPGTLRDAVRLRAFEGRSFEDAGRILGRNATAIRKRYSRALDVLRARLAAWGSEGGVGSGCPA